MAAEGGPAVPLAVHRLRVSYEVLQPLRLPAYRGPVLRAALLDALRARFCVLYGRDDERACGGEPGCQVCGFVAGLPGRHGRGAEPPRPYALCPPADSQTAPQPGDELRFGLSVFGTAIRYLPYLVVALREVSRIGSGHEAGRGRALRLRAVWEVNELTGEARRLSGDRQPHLVLPRLPMTAAQIETAARAMGGDGIVLDLRTPLRLIREGGLVHRLTFPALLRRVVARLVDLCGVYGEGPLTANLTPLLDAAAAIRVLHDGTRWQDVASPSSRVGGISPIGGLVGPIGFGGDLGPFLPWLLWGEIVQIGKDTTKGNGVYRIAAP